VCCTGCAGIVWAGRCRGRGGRGDRRGRNSRNRYDDLRTLGTPTPIADQVYQCAAVVGEQGVSSDLMGHPLACLAWLASSEVAAAFGGLKAG
jgi:2-keto-4-pentenoate hydratase